MRHTLSPRRGAVLSFALATAIANVGWAQQPPDAGSLLRQQPTPPIAPDKAAPTLTVPGATSVRPLGSGPQVLVKGFRLTGSKRFTDDELRDVLAPFVGQSLNLEQLRVAASLINGYYAERGYLARALLPPQNIQDGIVTIQVVEAERGSFRVVPSGGRLNPERIESLLANRVPSGPLSLAKLSEAVSILNEQPGIEAKLELAPAADPNSATVDFVVNAAAKPDLSYVLIANNQGSRSTGIAQLSASAALANPIGRFDQASAFVNAAEGSTLGRIDYGSALGSSGLRGSVSFSQLHYRLIQDSFKGLDGHGDASTANLSLNYPVVRAKDHKLSLSATLDQKRLFDYTVAGETGNRRVNVATLGIDGSLLDFLPEGVTSGSVTYTHGKSEENNAGARIADAASRQAIGSFNKFAWTLGHDQPLPTTWLLRINARGQVPGENLDSSERFSLGGASGVRAYPTGEGTGDGGWMASLSLLRRLGEKMSLSLFLDAGGIKQNHRTWVGWNGAIPDQPNRYELYGAGVGIMWQKHSSLQISATIASPLGNNPGRDLRDRNSDGSVVSARGWLTATAQF